MNQKLIKTVTQKSKRLGRGIGSGKGGHTSSRGQKGQKTRDNLGILFEGYKVRKSFIKRLPFLRGKGKFSPNKNKPFAISLSAFNSFEDGATVSPKDLIAKGIAPKEAILRGIKIIGGNLKKKIKFEGSFLTTKSVANLIAKVETKTKTK